MPKKKSLESESKSSGAKRKHASSDAALVCVEENVQSKVRKKRKKAEREEDVTLQIPEILVEADDDAKGEKPVKHKQTSEKTKKKKKRRKEIADPPTDPVATRVVEEEEEGEEDLSPEERRILERKMKKILKKEAKEKLKAAGKTEEKVEPSRPVAPQQALDYLTCWAENRKEWKFQKTRQTWLLQHMFDAEKIPDESFSVLLTYLEGLRGAARDTTIQKAETLVRELGDEPEHGVSQQRTHRAREVIQLLS